MSGWKGTRTRAVATLTLVLLGAACGGGQDFARSGALHVPDANATPATTATTMPPRDDAAAARLRAAVERTAARRTAQTSISVTVTGIGDRTLGAGALDIAGTGVVNLRSGDATLVLSVPRFDRITGGGPIAQRIVHGVSYIEMPAAIIRAGGLPAPVRWLRLDAHTAFAADASALAQAQVDPVGQLSFLASVSDDVRRVGDEAVRDVATTHYVGIVDATAHLSRTATGTSARSASIADIIGSARIAVDAWIDAAGRARRVVVSIPLSNATLGLAGPPGFAATMRVQADLYAFGTPVSVAVPPPAAVRPYAALHLPSVPS